MRKHTTQLGILLILVLCPGHVLGQDQTLTLATFNCEFLTRPRVHVKFGLPLNISQASAAEQQQWQQPGFRDQKFREGARAVAQVIRQVNADVIALTEVGNDTDVAELQTEVAALGLSYPFRAVCVSTDTQTMQHVAVLSKFALSGALTTIPGRESYVQEPDDPDTEEDTGISKGMRVTFTAHGREFLLYVLHLASERGGHEQDQQRIAQASIVRRHALPALAEGRLVIVAGDLNDHRGQPAIQRLRGLDDIQEDLIQTGHARYFEDAELATRWTYEFQGVREQIDHILLSLSIEAVCRQGGIKARTVDHGNTQASDHRPFVTTLRLRN